MGFPGGSDSKESTTMLETWIQSLGWEDPLEEVMATPAFLPGESPRREEPRELQSMGSQRVGHDWVTRQTTRKGELRLHKTMEAGEGEEESKRPEGGQQSNNRPTTHVAPHISDL